MVLSDTPSLSCIKANLGEAGARAVIAIAVSEVVLFFNVGKNMNASQVALTADLILQRYWYLKVEEIKAVFRKAMNRAKVFDRLDGNVIIGWIAEYDAERDDLMEQININEKNRAENAAPLDISDGIDFKTYASNIRSRVANGDKQAMELLNGVEFFEKMGADAQKKKTTDEDFRKWYTTVYLPNRLMTTTAQPINNYSHHK